ncbi:group I intron-associated PD-(D/E)XK endonuclease [Micromonospora sp. SL4-19]|uniref:group I intron-associated PD-(D/E)XK endonuclease n=1 Tax=Micromonospora sp. SL4-19 TaxID=3399129 RepID=UPI003A4DE8C7
MPRPRLWTHDQLRNVLPSARSWKEVCETLNVPIGGKTFKSLRKRADSLGLGYSHLYGNGYRHPVIKAVGDDRLRELVPQCRSWNHLAQEIGYANSRQGGWRPKLAARIEALGLSVEHFQGRGFNGLVPFANEPTFTADPRPQRLRVAATGKAIAWFSERGYVVSLPVEPAVYDLIVDSPNGFDRVQVKSSTTADRSVQFTRTVYDNRQPGQKSSGYVRSAPYEPGDIDYFFVVLGDGSMYLLPYDVIGRRKTANMGKRYEQFRV